MSTVIIPIFIVILLPIYTFAYLMYFGGFVESLIDITTLSNLIVHTFSYLVGKYFENITYIFISYGLLALFFIFLSKYFITNLFYNITYFISISLINIFIKTMNFFFCKDKISLIGTFTVKEDIRISMKQISKYNIFTFIKNLILSYLNLLFILFLMFIIPQMLDSTKNKNLSDANVIRILSAEYLKYSVFPDISNLKIHTNLDNKFRKIIFIGYDKTYSYINEIDSIIRLLQEYTVKTKDLKKNDKEKSIYNQRLQKTKEYCNKKTTKFSLIYSTFILGSTNESSNTIPIKNSDYILDSVKVIEYEKTIKKFNDILCEPINENNVSK